MLKLSATALLVCMAAGCGSGSKSGGSSATPTPTPSPTAAPAVQAAQAAPATALEGTFKTANCVFIAVGTCVGLTVVNRGALSTLTTTASDDGNTTQLTITRVRTFTIEGPDAESDTALKVNYTLVSASATVPADQVPDANTTAMYGYTNWTSDTPQDIAGKPVNGSATPEQAAGTVTDTIVDLDSAGHFLGGDLSGADDGSSNALRPTKLNEQFILEKQ